MDNPPVSLLTALAALVFVLCLICLAGRGLRLTRLAQGVASSVALGVAPGKRLSIADSLELGSRRRLLLVRCDGKDLLLLTGGTQDVMLGWLP